MEGVFHAHDGATPAQVLQTLTELELGYGYVVDEDNHFQGIVSRQSLEQDKNAPLAHAYLKRPRTLTSTSRLSEAIGKVATARYPVPVLDRNLTFRGTLSRTHLLETLEKADRQ